jgi:hypothetical protein
MRAIYGDAERDSAPQGLAARPEPDNETLTIGDLLGLFGGVHPERQRASSPQRPTSRTSSQPNRPTEPHTQPQHENGELNLSNIVEFLHNIAGQARDTAGGEHYTHEVRLSVWRVCIPLSNVGFTAEFGVSS